MKRLVLAAMLFALLSSCASAFADDMVWTNLEKELGRKGTVAGDVMKFAFPRTDMDVRVGGVKVEPGLALGSWIAFHREGGETAVMGDLVLLEDEVRPVMSKLLSENIWVTALHNHLLGEKPRVMYVHFGGRGEPSAMAKSFMAVLKLTKTPLEASAAKPSAKEPDWSGVESILGKGTHKGKILSFSFPRKDKVTEMGVEIPPAMGVATAINFQMDGGKAAAAGDFVLTPDEVNPVAGALMENGLTVTAIHSHMLFETPRLIFLHFWGYDKPAALAEGLKAALEKTGSAMPVLH